MLEYLIYGPINKKRPEIRQGEVSPERFRVLCIPQGEKEDIEGRRLGDDWLIADFGLSNIGGHDFHIYVTTDQLDASEWAGDALSNARQYVTIHNS